MDEHVVNTFICGFSILERKNVIFFIFCWDLNLWIALHMKYIKLNVQQTKMISQPFNLL